MLPLHYFEGTGYLKLMIHRDKAWMGRLRKRLGYCSPIAYLLVAFAVLFSAHAQSDGAPSPLIEGTITGQVVLGPIYPIERAGEVHVLTPLPGTTVVFLGRERQFKRSVITNDQGVYIVNLPLGTYSVTLPYLTQGQWMKDLSITLSERKEIHLDINVDSGIR